MRGKPMVSSAFVWRTESLTRLLLAWGLGGSWIGQQEGGDHVPHQVLRSQLNHVQIHVAEVGAVGEKSGEHAVGVRGREGEDEGPVEEPARVVQHAHGRLGKARPDHFLDLADRGQLSALTALLKLNLASEQTPEDLRDELVVCVGLCAQNFLQHVEEVVRVFIFLALEEELGVVKEVLAISDGHLVDASVELVKVELALVPHAGNLLSIGKECQKLLSLLLGLLAKLLGFGLVRTDHFGSNLVLQALGLGADVG
eukprot:CAMPEP_0170459942 /NCGR_PEP_ID=MMETSP0123-20130129/6467_1 /TAXON_ID=182087 /ORGANISM="Favella ehrenbergii, Strain Fehren 1" /LENGTH=254 /DNA_ID=CAMNT_0010724705 /DNA_START=657 /DNA_END=1419 /DNA_ORIENTATION=-